MADRVIAVGDDSFGNGEFAPIPAGTKLRVSVFDIEEGVTGPNSKNPGSPQFVYTAKVTQDFSWVDPEKGKQNAKGREIRYNNVPLASGVGNEWVLTSFAQAVGWKAEKGKGISVPENLKEVLGTEFTATIGHSTGNDGKVYNRITRTAPASKDGGGTETPTVKSWDQL